MKFTCRVEVKLPREKVIEIWKAPANLQHWQDGFERYEHLSGTIETVGSKGMLHYNIKGKPMELEEIILEWSLPDVMEGEYVHKHMTNRMRNSFEELDANTENSRGR